MCHPPYRDRVGDTETSQDRFGSREESKRACYPEMEKRVERKFKKVKRTILTMKSLILAQDER